jgi:phosphatidylserine synthase
LFVLALGMVSTIRFPKFQLRESMFINIFQGFNFFATFYCGITRNYPEFLFFMGLFLLVSGSIAGRITRNDSGSQK